MFFYTISNGEYSDYSPTTIYHEKKFTNKEFVEMYNKVLERTNKESFWQDDVAELMVELFGFKLLEVEYEIHVGYGSHKPINLNEVSEEFNSHYRNGL
jgi:hypothetical protein